MQLISIISIDNFRKYGLFKKNIQLFLPQREFVQAVGGSQGCGCSVRKVLTFAGRRGSLRTPEALYLSLSQKLIGIF